VSRGLAELAALVRPGLLAWGLASIRVLPVALLCPVLGGQLVPAPVRLAVSAALGLALEPLVGTGPEGSLDLLGRCAREAAVGLLIGMGAALPFDAARIGGRLADLVRGTSAEAALPVAGHREAATGDVLHQLLVSLAVAGGALPVLVRALARSYVLAPSGTSLAAGGPLGVARLVGVALATGLAVAAPVVALSWATDATVGLVLRAAPGLPATELATPVRILGGGTVLWLSLGLVADRLLSVALSSDTWLPEVLGR
jgi:type III secretion protein T